MPTGSDSEVVLSTGKSNKPNSCHSKVCSHKKKPTSTTTCFREARAVAAETIVQKILWRKLAEANFLTKYSWKGSASRSYIESLAQIKSAINHFTL